MTLRFPITLDYPHAALVNLQMGATRPISSLLVVVAAGVIALMLVPEANWEETAALRASGLVLSAGLLFSVLLAAFRNPIALFRAELILMAGLVYWLVFDAIQPRYGIYAERAGVIRMIGGVAIFASFFWAGTIAASAFRGKPRPFATTSDIGSTFVFWAGFACALMGLSYKTLSCHLQPSCIFELWQAGRANAWMIEPNLDPAFAPLARLRYAGYLATPLTVAFFIIERRPSWRGLILGVVTLSNLLLLLGDGRRSVGTTLGAGILIFVLLRHQIRLRHLVSLVAGAALVLLLMEAMLAWRDVGVGRSLVEGAEIDTGPGIISVDKNLFHGSRAAAIVPEFHPHTGWKGVVYSLGHFIPRALWNRPPKLGFDYARATGRRGGSTWTATYSIIGDLWIVGGVIAMALGGLAYGVLANLASRLLLLPASLRSRLLYATAVMALFVSLRALHELSVTGLAVVALWGLFKARDLLLTRSVRPRLVTLGGSRT